MSQSRPYCLSIAGFDPSAGAGILADIKTFEQLGVYGLGVTTAHTYQNDNNFEGLEWYTPDNIVKQIEALRKYPVRFVKFGLIESIERLEELIKVLDRYFNRPGIIWDPVLKATAGFDFHDQVKLNDFLSGRISLITPNLPEYQKIEATLRQGTNVLIKGGHSTNRGTDILKTGNKEIMITGEPFKAEIDKHGTGCVLSAAITAYLARNYSLGEACRKAKKYTEKFILSNQSNLGYHT